MIDAGYEVTPAARDLLREYSGLHVVSPDDVGELWLDGRCAADLADPKWCQAYTSEVGAILVPVGGYSHMTVLTDPGGGLWGGFDDQYGCLAADVVGLVEALLLTSPPTPLDRRLGR